MKNYLEDGDLAVVTTLADQLSGDFIVIGSLYGVCQTDAKSGVTVAIVREGVFSLPKATGAWLQGDALYWDASAKNFTKTAAGNKRIGVAFADAASGDANGQVSIDEVPEGGDLVNPVIGVGAAYKIARGVHQQAAASDTIVTGLTTVVACGASWRDTPTLKQLFLTTSIGDQSAAPVAGSILVKSFKPTAANDVTPIAASDFTDNLSSNWWAIGT